MEQGFGILMLIFAAAIFLYAALLAITKDYRLLPYKATLSVKPKNPKAYTFQLSKVIALVALSIAVGAAIALWKPAIGAVIMVAGAILAIWAGTKIMKKVS